MLDGKQLKIDSNSNCNRMLSYNVTLICLVCKVPTAMKTGEMDGFCAVQQVHSLSFLKTALDSNLVYVL
jgi:hypothetical protein